MPRHSCGTCRAPLHDDDGHGECVFCLGKPHAEAALTETSCCFCESMSLASLRSRIAFFNESDPAPRAPPSFSSREPARKRQRGRGAQRPDLGELTPAQHPRASPSPMREPSPVLFSRPEQRPSAEASDLVSFGGLEDEPLDDSMSLAASANMRAVISPLHHGTSAAHGLRQEQSLFPSEVLSEDARADGFRLPSFTARPPTNAAPAILAETPGPTLCLAARPLRIRVNQACLAALEPWMNPFWFSRGVPLQAVSRRTVLSTDASNLGWGALCEGRPAFGSWSHEESHLHINCLEMLAVERALQSFQAILEGRHVLVQSDSMTVVSYINH